MPDLILIGDDDPQTARQASEQVQRLRQDSIVDVDADGRTHVDTSQPIIGGSMAAGAVFGLLPGALFFVQGCSAAPSARSWARSTRRASTPRSSSAWPPWSSRATRRSATAMHQSGGTVLETSLSDSDEREQAEELAGQS